MTVIVKLRDGSELEVEATLAEFEQLLHKATEYSSILEIENPDDGHILAVTPHAVQYFQEIPAA